MSRYEPSTYYFIHLIGSNPDANKNSSKIDGYYQITNGILINYFATKFYNINSHFVKVFAYGDKTNYNAFIYTNNRSYFQLDLHNIFQLDGNLLQRNFEYFTNFEIILPEIEKIIQNNQTKKIILFLDDHGSKGFFSKIGYFHLYKLLMKYPENQILILNDSCYSGSLINIVKGYNELYKLKTANGITSKIDPHLLFSFLKLIKYALKNSDIKQLFQRLHELIIFYQNINFSDDSILNKLINLEIPSYFKADLSVDKVCDFANELNQNKFSTVQNIIDFQNIFQSTKMNENEDNKAIYAMSKKTFTKANLDLIIKFSNGNRSKLNIKDIQLFIESLEGLYISHEYVDFELPPHPNIEIITSTDENSKCLSFPSITVNKVIRVYPGSPVMSSFIKELFLNTKDNELNFDNIKKDVSEFDGNFILFPATLIQNDRTEHKKKKWVHLFPKHYKQSDYNYSLCLSDDVKLRVAALRAISSLLVKNLKESIKLLNEEENLCKLNSSNDNMAAIVAVIAVLSNKLCKKDSKAINVYIDKIITKFEDQSGIQMLQYIIAFSYNLSDSPIKMACVILNVLKEAINFEILNNMQNQSNLKHLFFDVNNETSTNNNESNLNNINIKSEYITDIENAVFSLLNPNATFFGSLIALSLTSKIDIKKIKDCKSYLPELQSDSFFLQFIESLENDNIQNGNIIEKAECYILSYVKSSLIYLDSICSLQMKNDTMRYVSHQLQYFSTISIIKLLLERIDDDQKNKCLIENLIDPIEKAVLNANISTFYIPCILASIPSFMIVNAIYIFNKSFDDTINILEKIFNGNLDANACNGFIELAKFVLPNAQNKTDIIDKMKKEISDKISESVKRLIKLLNISKIRAIENTSKRIKVDFLIDQINEYKDFLNIINDRKYTNKFHKYLYESITSLSNELKNFYDPRFSEIPQKGFNINESLTNTDSLIKRAANEIFTLTHIFDISDEANKDKISELSERIDSKKAFKLSYMAMITRCLNMVEMIPIAKELNQFKKLFVTENGENPNSKEIMGLLSASIYILSKKDADRERFKIVGTSEFEEKYRKSSTEDRDNEENDLYYSDNFYEDINDLPFRKIKLESIGEKTYLEQYPNFPLLPKPKYCKGQISQGKIDMLKDELGLGWSSFGNEIWIAFVYCFNDRMKNINIHFDQNDDYNCVTCPGDIDNVVCIIRKFFPIHEVPKFWENKERIERFVGQNRKFSKEIFDAIIKAFDDADRIVSPIHVQTETYEERTTDILKLIFNS